MHVNKSLPPVGIKILIKVSDNSWLTVKRDQWITNQDSEIEFDLPDLTKIYIKRSNIQWTYI